MEPTLNLRLGISSCYPETETLRVSRFRVRLEIPTHGPGEHSVYVICLLLRVSDYNVPTPHTFNSNFSYYRPGMSMTDLLTYLPTFSGF